jgi:hypothetical protein
VNAFQSPAPGDDSVNRSKPVPLADLVSKLRKAWMNAPLSTASSGRMTDRFWMSGIPNLTKAGAISTV